MTPEPAVEMVGIGKRYWKLDEQAMLLKSVLPFSRPTRSELWALRNVDLTIERGETVGIIGHNGAGKTTLLRLLAGVSQPSVGHLRIAGRIAPLIGVGVGFHPEMSGRENVLVNGMLLGMTKAEIDERFDDIVAFAELEEFIDTPVKFYSSGMFLRLGFAVAVHVEPGVLLVDEVLAVGDWAFQLKCVDRMRALQGSGTTIVIVSHSQNAVRLLCPRVIVMGHGEVQFDGETTAAIAHYHRLLSEGSTLRRAPGETPDVTLLHQEVVGASGAVGAVQPHEPLRLRASFRCERPVDSPMAFFTVLTKDGTVAYHLIPRVTHRYHRYEAGDVIEVEVRFDAHLAGGSYQLGLALYDNAVETLLYEDPAGIPLYVVPRLGSVGVAELDAVAFVGGHDITDRPERVLDGELRPGPSV